MFVLRNVNLAKPEKKLQSQLSILTEKNANPFEIDESGVAIAAPKFLIVDSGQDEDEGIDIIYLTLVEFICLTLIVT